MPAMEVRSEPCDSLFVALIFKLLGNYTFPPDYLWYRGQDINIGGYNFRTVYPAVYEDRPIPHYHYLVRLCLQFL